MINAKNEIQYFLVTQVLENMVQAGFLSDEECGCQTVGGEEIPTLDCLGMVIAFPGVVW